MQKFNLSILGIMTAILTYPTAVLAEKPSVYRKPSYLGAIGETGHLYLPNSNINFNPMYNDIIGKTDKNLSGAAYLGAMKLWSDSGLQLKSSWRFITPDVRKEFKEDEVSEQNGRFADWVAFETAYAKVTKIGDYKIRYQLSLGLDIIGNNGAQRIHKMIHTFTNSVTENLFYIDQPSGHKMNKGLEIGYVIESQQLMGLEFESLVNFGIASRSMMNEGYIALVTSSQISDNFRFAFEARKAFQINSEFYHKANSGREELAAGMMLFGFYKTSLKYVSSYIQGDEKPQLYWDLFDFYYEF